MTLRFDYGNLLTPKVGGGIDPELIEGHLASAFRDAYATVEARRSSGDLGFLDLPYATEAVDNARELADGYAQWFEDVVVLGIGGSGLGAAALQEALLGRFWNDRSGEERDHFPRLHVVDNPDPHTFRGPTRPSRSGADALQRREQVWGDRGDDGAVSRRAGVCRGSGRCREGPRSLPLHHGSTGRCAPSDR